MSGYQYQKQKGSGKNKGYQHQPYPSKGGWRSSYPPPMPNTFSNLSNNVHGMLGEVRSLGEMVTLGVNMVQNGNPTSIGSLAAAMAPTSGQVAMSPAPDVANSNSANSIESLSKTIGEVVDKKLDEFKSQIGNGASASHQPQAQLPPSGPAPSNSPPQNDTVSRAELNNLISSHPQIVAMEKDVASVKKELAQVGEKTEAGFAKMESLLLGMKGGGPAEATPATPRATPGLAANSNNGNEEIDPWYGILVDTEQHDTFVEALGLNGTKLINDSRPTEPYAFASWWGRMYRTRSLSGWLKVFAKYGTSDTDLDGVEDRDTLAEVVLQLPMFKASKDSPVKS